MSKQKPKFRRPDAHKYSKLGVRRKKKQVYRKSKGRDNKIRLNKAGRLRKVKVGFRTAKKTRDLINGMKMIRVFNLKDIKAIKEGEIGVLAKVGNKKKKEIAEYIQKNNVRLVNLNPGKFLEKIELTLKKKKEDKSERSKKKTARDKKAKEKTEKEEKDEEKKKDEGKKETVEDKVDTINNIKPDEKDQAKTESTVKSTQDKPEPASESKPSQALTEAKKPEDKPKESKEDGK